jgi:hypothetical protein
MRVCETHKDGIEGERMKERTYRAGKRRGEGRGEGRCWRASGAASSDAIKKIRTVGCCGVLAAPLRIDLLF